MSYCIFRLRANIFIANEHKSHMLAAIKKLDPRKTYPESHDAHFAFVKSSMYQQAKTWTEALQAWRWLPILDEEDNIIDLEFLGEKLGDENVLFEAIAPYVNEGSDIQMAGEDGQIWRWIFSNATVQKQSGEITFGSPSTNKN